MTITTQAPPNKEIIDLLYRSMRQLPPLAQLSGMTYIASPYWHRDPGVMADRKEKVTQATANLIAKGLVAFCPVSYTADMESLAQGDLNWYEFDLNFLALSQQMLILKLEGWVESRGILLETGFARARGIPIYGLDLDSI